MIKSKDLVSICIPTYNRVDSLSLTIPFLLSSNHHYEVIVSDNNSNDGTQFFINSISDRRLKYFKNDVNHGAIYNIFSSLAKGTAKYRLLMSDEDYVDVNSVINLIEEIDKYNPSYVELKENLFNFEQINCKKKRYKPNFFSYLSKSDSTNYMSGMIFNSQFVDFNMYLSSFINNQGMVSLYPYPQNLIKRELITKSSFIITTCRYFKRGPNGTFTQDLFQGEHYYSVNSRLKQFKLELDYLYSLKFEGFQLLIISLRYHRRLLLLLLSSLQLNNTESIVDNVNMQESLNQAINESIRDLDNFLSRLVDYNRIGLIIKILFRQVIKLHLIYISRKFFKD